MEAEEAGEALPEALPEGWLFLLLLGLVLVGAALLWLWRARRRLERGIVRVDAAWAVLERALGERIAALEAMVAALEGAGYVPEARGRLREAVAALRAAQGPRALAAADRAVETVLLAVYRGLPRERVEEIRVVQNRLALADEERDRARTAYNDLVLSWALLVRRFPYRTLARRRGLVPREPFLLPGEEADYVRRHFGHP
ncbi:MAG: LemA family protein [Candidatus Bipolaricaulota bacterium]|nr:LemA family protein [Candidatus Bipolaricaulota bacterium]